jgi:putative transposase
LAHHNTVFAQLLKFIPRHEFEALANQHHQGQKLRKMTHWSQFVALTMAQLSRRSSLRDIVSNLTAQATKLYHLGSAIVTRSTLARVNEAQPYTLYESLFYKLLAHCQGLAPRHDFRFKNKLYSLDATTIDLCLSIFPWAKFRTTKGAVKVHVSLDHDGMLPSFITVTDGKTHDVIVDRTLALPADSIVVMDRAYTDYAWFNALNDKGIFFVTRQKSNASYRVIGRHDIPKDKGLTCDQTIRITGTNAAKCPTPLRRIGYRDPDTGKHYVFLTNNFHLAAKTIADIYKARWQIELFFKYIKQNLKIKLFIGTSRNAVLTQIWIAMCAYLLLAWIKFSSRTSGSLQRIIRLLQLNLFDRRDIMTLLKGDPREPPDSPHQAQLRFL